MEIQAGVRLPQNSEDARRLALCRGTTQKTWPSANATSRRYPTAEHSAPGFARLTRSCSCGSWCLLRSSTSSSLSFRAARATSAGLGVRGGAPRSWHELQRCCIVAPLPTRRTLVSPLPQMRWSLAMRSRHSKEPAGRLRNIVTPLTRPDFGASCIVKQTFWETCPILYDRLFNHSNQRADGRYIAGCSDDERS